MYWMNGLVLVICLSGVWTMPTMPDDSPMDMNQTMGYLKKYGYLGEKMPMEKYRKMAETDMDGAVTMAFKFFQTINQRYGLNITGEPDMATMKLMNMSRCGNEDMISIGTMMKRKKRYMLYGTEWPKTTLTYSITRYPSDNDLSEDHVDTEIRRAFAVWAAVTPLKFYEKSRDNNVDIVIKFSPTHHGDNNPFDGPSGTLAHAYFPTSNPIGGDAHFDDAETWTMGTTDGVNLFQVAVHEFGHSLGLSHSEDPTALMAPFYQGYMPNFELANDDVNGIQALYGPNQQSVTTRKPTTTTRTTMRTTRKPVTKTTTTKRPYTVLTTELPGPADKQGMKEICNNPKFDAITMVLNEGKYKTYAFQGAYYFQLDSNGFAHGYPKTIKDHWPGLPDNVDAAVFWDAIYDDTWVYNEEKMMWEITKKINLPAATFVFKGDKYWRVEDMTVVRGYPKDISEWELPADIDAAFVWRPDGKTYFIKGDQYYGYSEDVGVGQEYPQPLSAWGNVPSTIDAAKEGPLGQTYFFSDNNYYVYNDTQYKVQEVLEIEPNWLKCYTSKATDLKVSASLLLGCLLLFSKTLFL